MQIMYVEDDQDDQELFGELVKEIDPNHEIIFASTGMEALEMLKSDLLHLPDIIFLDVNLPMIDGYQTLIEMRKIERLRDIKVVFLSTAINPATTLKHKDCLENVMFCKKASSYDEAKENVRVALKLSE